MDAAIANERERLGWRAYLTNAPVSALSGAEAVLTYRDEWRVEMGFRRLKGVPLSVSPLFVQRDDQAIGLMHLLSLGLRVLSVMEFVLRQRLQQQGKVLVGLYRDRPTKATNRPTIERILQAFDNLNLTTVVVHGQRFAHAPPLSELQLQILQALGLSADIYSRLVENA
jgi:transposase